MSTTKPVAGYLIITTVNSETGEASSETYQLANLEYDNGGERAVFQVKNEDGENWVITYRPASSVPLEVTPYRELIRRLIAADVGCPGPMCKVTMLGHLLDGCKPEQVELVKALDPDWREEA